jgi:hypothetical protein
MSFVMTYNSLVDKIKEYLERTDSSLVDQIPTFIQLAETRLARELKHLGFQRVVTNTFSQGQATVAKPSRWRETISFNYGSGTGNNTRNTVFQRSYEYCRTYWPDPTVTGAPKYFADYNYSNWLIAPTPDSAYPFEIVYYEMVQPIDSTNQTNWLTEFAPDLLLYATLLETAPYLKVDERIPVWQQMYDRAMAAEKGQDIHRLVDRDQISMEGSK